MFKRTFYVLLLAFIFIGGTYVSACMDMRFDDADICIDIDKDGEDYELDTDIDASTSVAITCHILLPDGEDRNVSENDCQGEFEYDDEDTEKVKLYVVVNGEYDTLEEYYDFDRGEWDEDGNSSNGDLDNFDFDVSDKTPEKDDEVNITIEALDDNDDIIDNYNEEVTLLFEILNDSDRVEADKYDLKIESNDFSDDENDLDNGELIVDFEDGELNFDVRFDENEEYRITIEDDYENIDEDQEFDVGGTSSSNGDLDYFDFDVSDTSPEKDDEVNITIEALDDNDDVIDNYDEEVTLLFEIRDGSDRIEADEYDLQIDSNDFSDDENDLDNGELTVDFNNGELDFDVRFDENEEYRITIEDDYENIDEDQEFDVGGTSSSNGDLDYFDFDVSDTSPEKDDEVNITIEALDDNDDVIDNYDEEVTLLFEIRDGYSRRDADDRDLEIDSNDFSDDENDLDNGELTVDFNNGELDFDVRFDESEEYRITVEDENEDIDEDQEFDVDGYSSSNGDIDDFELDASDETPDEDEWVDLEIIAIDSDDDTVEDYEGKLRFEVQRKDSDGDWITSSTSYYDIDRSYYNMDSSDDGEVILEDFIRFSREYEFKVKVYDDDDSNIYEYIEFDVGDTNDDDDDYDGFNGFELDISPSHPEEGVRIDLTIEATDEDDDRDRDFEGTVKFKVEKKSGAYRHIASVYTYSIDSLSEYIDEDDDGRIEVDGLIKFKEEGEYRLKVYDEEQFTRYGFVFFDIGADDEDDDSDTDGFSNKEYDQIKAIYNIWPNVIDQLEGDYYKLRYSDDWKEESDDFYENMNDVIDNSSSRDFDDYDDFFDAFLDRYTLTIETR